MEVGGMKTILCLSTNGTLYFSKTEKVIQSIVMLILMKNIKWMVKRRSALEKMIMYIRRCNIILMKKVMGQFCNTWKEHIDMLVTKSHSTSSLISCLFLWSLSLSFIWFYCLQCVIRRAKRSRTLSVTPVNWNNSKTKKRLD